MVLESWEMGNEIGDIGEGFEDLGAETGDLGDWARGGLIISLEK